MWHSVCLAHLCLAQRDNAEFENFLLCFHILHFPSTMAFDGTVSSMAECTSIQRRLQSALDLFFSASATGDASSLLEFTSEWETLYADTVKSQSCGALDEETLHLAYTVADAIETLSTSLTELSVSDETVTNNYVQELKKVVDDERSKPASTSSFPSPTKPTQAYIEPAYRWLVENLHNPYPIREVRNKICRETNTPRKDLDNWFTNARRRIGWNTLLKSFGGDRDRLVEAATTYFFGEDENQYDHIAIAFADMESTLTDLYSGKFEQSNLGRKLGGVVKNMTPELQAQEQANKKRREEQREAERKAKKARMERAREVDARRAYPSPDRSPGRSVDPSLPSEATPSRKRRSSDDDEDSDSDAPRSKKRSRYVSFLLVFATKSHFYTQNRQQ